MGKPNRGTYVLREKEVRALMANRGMSQAQLAKSAKISTVTLSRILNGKPAAMGTIKMIARILEIEEGKYEEIIYIKSGEPITDNSKSPANTDIKIRVYDSIKNTYSIIVASDAAIMLQELAEKREVLLVIGASIVALLCCIIAMAPIDARPFLIVGTIFSALGIALSYRRKSHIIVPIIALILNLSASFMLPLAVGWFPTTTGYRFGVGEKPFGSFVFGPLKLPLKIYLDKYPPINEIVTVAIDKKVYKFFIPVSGERLYPDLGKDIFLLDSLRTEVGIHDIEVTIGKESISRRIEIGSSIDPNAEKSLSDSTFRFQYQADEISKYTNVMLLIFDNKKDTTIYYYGNEPHGLPKETSVSIDGSPVDLEEVIAYAFGGCFRTSVGWHTIVVKFADGKIVTRKFFAYPPSNATDHPKWAYSDEQYSKFNVIRIKHY